MANLHVGMFVTKGWNTLREFLPDFCSALQSGRVDAADFGLTDFTENHVVYNGHFFKIHTVISSSLGDQTFLIF